MSIIGRRSVPETQDSMTGLDETLSGREYALVRSSYRVITRQGGHRTSLQDIADEAGVSKGLLLYHFKSKDFLLLATMRWALRRTADRIRTEVGAASGDGEQTIDALMDAVFVGPAQNRDFYLLYLDLIEHSAREESFNRLSDITSDIIDQCYADLIRGGIEREVFDVADSQDAAVAVRAYIDGTFMTWLQERDWEATYPSYRQRCRTGLLALLRTM